METVHLLANYLGEEYAKAVSAYLDHKDTAAHSWVRNRKDKVPIIIIEEKIQKKRS